MKVYIIGAGPGNTAYLTDYARELIIDAEAVLTTARLYEQLGYLNTNTKCLDISELADHIIAIQNEHQSVCVLVSGDTGFYSASKKLRTRLFEAGIAVECISGISSLQYLTNVLGQNYDDIVTVSVHGRNNIVVPYICYNPKVFVLTGGAVKAHDVIRELNLIGLGDAIVSAGENLGTVNERIITGRISKLAESCIFEDLTVLFVENPAYIKYWEAIDDEAFIRDKTPMTKQAVRRLLLAKLSITPYDTVLDIGAGTGSVSIEAARLAHCSMVYAVEKNTAAVKLIRQNISKFGAYNVVPIEMYAPDGFEDLPKIDKAFIGGSSGDLNRIVTALLRNNPKIRLVISAITVETLNVSITSLKDCGLVYDIMCVNVAVGEKNGSYHLMKAQNPVYIISTTGGNTL